MSDSTMPAAGLAPIYVELASNVGSYATGQIYGASGGTGVPFQRQPGLPFREWLR